MWSSRCYLAVKEGTLTFSRVAEDATNEPEYDEFIEAVETV